MKPKPLHRHRPVWRGELALLAAVIFNSFAVVLMLYSGAGISAISSVPYAFSDVFPQLSLGTWTYLFQGLLILSLMILRKRFVVEYLFSFVVGFVFSELMDLHELWISVVPTGLGMGTILAAFTTGKAVGLVGEYLDKRVRFLSILTQRRIDRIKGVRHENKSL